MKTTQATTIDRSKMTESEIHEKAIFAFDQRVVEYYSEKIDLYALQKSLYSISYYYGVRVTALVYEVLGAGTSGEEDMELIVALEENVTIAKAREMLS